MKNAKLEFLFTLAIVVGLVWFIFKLLWPLIGAYFGA